MCMLDEVYAITRMHKTEKLWAAGREGCPDSDVDLLVKFGDDAQSLDMKMRLGRLKWRRSRTKLSGMTNVLGRNEDKRLIRP